MRHGTTRLPEATALLALGSVWLLSIFRPKVALFFPRQLSQIYDVTRLQISFRLCAMTATKNDHHAMGRIVDARQRAAAREQRSAFCRLGEEVRGTLSL